MSGEQNKTKQKKNYYFLVAEKKEMLINRKREKKTCKKFVDEIKVAFFFIFFCFCCYLEQNTSVNCQHSNRRLPTKQQQFNIYKTDLKVFVSNKNYSC